MKSTIPEVIITLRESHNLSQAQLAKLMGLNKNIIGRIEHGSPITSRRDLKIS